MRRVLNMGDMFEFLQFGKRELIPARGDEAEISFQCDAGINERERVRW